MSPPPLVVLGLDPGTRYASTRAAEVIPQNLSRTTGSLADCRVKPGNDEGMECDTGSQSHGTRNPQSSKAPAPVPLLPLREKVARRSRVG